MDKQLFIFKSICLVDDDLDDAELFEDALKRIAPGQTFFKFSSGTDLLNTITNDPPEIIFLDLSMPHPDGFECLRAIRESQKSRHLPVIVYSSSPHPTDVMRSYGLGANLYIKKPSSYKDILRTLEQVLQMDWSNPMEITNNHFIDGKHVPFRA
jgi:CheY-like chemotaxis protein